jgi:hypothetical protein
MPSLRSGLDPPREAAGGEACDRHAAIDAAEALGLKEFEFFRLAYRRWFGRQPDLTFLEHAFVDYLFSGRLPPWVRQLAREVQAAQRQGRLTGGAFDSAAYRDRPSRHPHGHIYIGAVLVIWFAFVSVLMNLRPDSMSPATGTCAAMSGLPVVEVVGGLFAGGRRSCDEAER